MATPSRSSAAVNRRSPTIRRILREAAEIQKSPSRDFTARPLEEDIFVWHFTLRGPPEPSPFANGFYHGRILLSANYPLRPPMFRFLTPSGRFEVNRDICLSMSGFHEETWQPAWGIRTALVALRAFMDTDSEGQVGGMDSDKGSRKRMADESQTWRCSECGGGGEEEVMQIPESSEKETIPEELQLGYKDELKGNKKSEKDDASGTAAAAGATASGATADQAATAAIVTETPATSSSNPQQPSPGILTPQPRPNQNQNQNQQQQAQFPFQPPAEFQPTDNMPQPQPYPYTADLAELQQAFEQFQQYHQNTFFSPQFMGNFQQQQQYQDGLHTPPLQQQAAPGSPPPEYQNQQQHHAQYMQPPIHTFLHPNQDRGTTIIDIAIGVVVSLLAVIILKRV